MPERHQQARYIIAMLPAAQNNGMVEIGASLRVNGRFIGVDVIGEQRYPIVLARQAVVPNDESAQSLLGMGQTGAELGSVSLAEDPSIFEEINDIGTLLEWRPYALTLGRVASETASGETYADAPYWPGCDRSPSSTRGFPRQCLPR